MAKKVNNLSSTAERFVPERFGQSEARASRNEKLTGKFHSFVPRNGFNRCNM